MPCAFVAEESELQRTPLLSHARLLRGEPAQHWNRRAICHPARGSFFGLSARLHGGLR